jgi:hypothetical protein
MIVSVSRRTDVPAFFGEWFVERLRHGFCLVPNPFNRSQVTRISLARSDVDAFVFWTRFPAPFAPAFDALDRRGDPYLVLLTLTGYGPPLEPGAPPVGNALHAAQKLAGRIGRQRLVWRYDPILFGPGLDPGSHLERFARLATGLEGLVDAVRVSFVDLYRKTRRRLAALPGGEAFLVDPAATPAAGDLLAGLAALARAHGMSLSTCAEERDWSAADAPPGACVDGALLERLFGIRAAGKDPGQRAHCRCAPSRDVGITDTCRHGCVYCYATSSHEVAARRSSRHDPGLPSLLSLPGREPYAELTAFGGP